MCVHVMRVLIIDIDSKIPNLALKKAERYHLDRGDEVEWDMPLMANQADLIYVSCVFKKNRHKAEEYEVYEHALIGGSGYDLKVTLPPEIEAVRPRINMGFTTRGCIRQCGFCVVPEKEGDIRIIGDLFDLWDGEAKQITLLDNNILAVPEHFFSVCAQARERGIRLDFNGGLDHRLLTPEIVSVLAETSHVVYKFAYDRTACRAGVNRAIALLEAVGIRRSTWYVLVGYDTTLRQDLQRLNHLRFMDQRAFVQRYAMRPEYIPLARWANQRHMFRGMTFGQFLKEPRKKNYYIRIYGREKYKELLAA